MRSLPRTFAVIPLTLALALPPPSRGQGFVIPLGPEILIGPLLLLIIPLAMQLSRSDESRIRELEARSDWSGLAQLASRRLARDPGNLYWLELRGRTLQRRGRCEEAMADLRPAFEGQVAKGSPYEDALSAGLALGMCELAAPDLVAAAQTFERLRQLMPLRAEPVYQLGVIRTMQGDTAAADAALATLESLNAPLAESLRNYRQAFAGTAPANAAPATAAAAGTAPATLRETPPAEPARPVPLGRLDIGSRALQLPAANWYLASRSESTIRAGPVGPLPGRTDVVPLVTLRAYGLTPEGGFAAAAEFSANSGQSFGTFRWRADDGCAVPQSLHLHRFRAGVDQPECVYVRMVNPQSDSRWAPVVRRPGLSAPEAAYEVHYERYGTGWVVAATWLLPVRQVAGDMAAVQWAHAMAAQLRPLASASHPAPAVTPALGSPD